MSEKTYFAKNESLKSYADLNYLDLDQHEKIWKNIIKNHPFNQALTLFLPSCSINTTAEQINKDLGHYYQVTTPLSVLLEPEFFKKYIKSDQHQITMHSLETNLNTDNVVVLNPDGKLYLSLNKNTYETFGIVALKRTKADIKHDKHLVMIDLKKSTFDIGSKEYERLKWCFENTLKDQFKLVFCLCDSLTGITLDIEFPSIISNISKMEVQAEFETLTDINIPSFNNMNYSLDQAQPKYWDSEAMDALEWIGLAHLKANRIKHKKDKVDPFVSVYQAPLPLADTHRGTLVKFKGLIPTPCIENLMVVLRKLMKSNTTNQWASLTCWGFRDSPNTWNNLSHYQYFNGENDYTFLLLPNNKNGYLYQLYGSHHLKF